MVEYKITGKNKVECAKDYIENHLGEEIKFLNNVFVNCGFIFHRNDPVSNNPIWRVNEERMSLYFTVEQIAKAMYFMSHRK
jgi:hypothetical protein